MTHPCTLFWRRTIDLKLYLFLSPQNCLMCWQITHFGSYFLPFLFNTNARFHFLLFLSGHDVSSSEFDKSVQPQSSMDRILWTGKHFNSLWKPRVAVEGVWSLEKQDAIITLGDCLSVGVWARVRLRFKLNCRQFQVPARLENHTIRQLHSLKVTTRMQLLPFSKMIADTSDMYLIASTHRRNMVRRVLNSQEIR